MMEKMVKKMKKNALKNVSIVDVLVHVQNGDLMILMTYLRNVKVVMSTIVIQFQKNVKLLKFVTMKVVMTKNVLQNVWIIVKHAQRSVTNISPLQVLQEMLLSICLINAKNAP